MTTLFKHYCRRKIALAMSGLILLESVFPPSGWALTSGPGQPEFASFEPVSTSNMINPFTGDFTYNLPVLEVPGASGGGYALSLAYNSGASPEEEASWVGYGWNLNPGAINRQKRGLPDDFYSKKVTYRNKMPKNWTVGLGGSIGNLEAFSFDIPLSVNAELRYNNYKGLGYTVGAGVNLAAGAISLGYNVSDGEGSFSVSVNPAAYINSKVAEGQKKSEDSPTTKSSATGRKYADKLISQSGITLLGSSYGLFSYSDAVRATNSVHYEGASYRLGVSVMPTPAPVQVGPNFGVWGSYTWQQSLDRNLNSFGYMYSAHAQGKDMMDYYIEKSTPYQKRDLFLGIPFNNADNFTVSGEGVGGGFRFYNRNAGHFRPNHEKNEEEIIQLGVEIEAGMDVGAGLDIGVGWHSLETDTWQQPGNTGQYSFAPEGQDEFVFARFNNDLGGNVLFGKHDGFFSADVKQTPGVPGAETASLDLSGGELFKSANEGKRAGRSSYIAYHTNEEMNQSLNNKFYKRYTQDAGTNGFVNRGEAGLGKGIGELAVTNEDGNRYVYGLPVYARNELNLQYSLEGGNTQVHGNYWATRDIAGSNEPEVILGEESAAPYTTSHLLTEITTPDYVDRTMDGPSRDDFGGYTKFNYVRQFGPGNAPNGEVTDKSGSPASQWFTWRTPYKGLLYHRNELSDRKDDLGSVMTGEKEIYYMKSIETKTHIAYFVLGNTSLSLPNGLVIKGSGEARKDAMAASDHVSATKGDKNGNLKRLQKLERIELYAKDENGNAKEKIKTVHFQYDYSLCKGLPNADAGAGKLTLKKMWTEYGSITNAQISPYTFTYQYPVTPYPTPYQNLPGGYNQISATAQNPDYSPFNIDAWGNYQANGENRYAQLRPWVNQQPNNAVFDPAAWQLKQIGLPSGGQIHVQYEQKDYHYVQDRLATGMVSLLPGDDQSQNNKYYLNLADLGITSGEEKEELVDLIEHQYLKTDDRIHFKFFYTLLEIGQTATVAGGKCNGEFVDGYAKVSEVGIESGKVYLKLKDDSGTPVPKQICREFLKANRAGKLNPLGDCNAQGGFEDSGSAAEVIMGFLGFAGSLTEDLVPNIDATCTRISPVDSYLRIPLTRDKKGGGVRVKRLLMYDAGLETSDKVLYGSEYIYQTTDEKGKVISSGVAVNESATIREENALVGFLPRFKQSFANKIIAGRDKKVAEGPIGESILPTASIGYSKVIQKNIHSGKTNKGFVVTDYFTARDYPYDKYYPNLDANGAGFSPMDKEDDWLILPTGLFNVNVSNVWLSQGFNFIVNNMHGQVKCVSTYSGDYTDLHNVDKTILSAQQSFTYFEPGEKIPFYRGVNQPVAMGDAGKEMDVTSEMRSVRDIYEDGNLEIDLDVGIYILFVVPFVTAFPSYTYSESILETHANTKVTRYPAIRKSVLTFTDGLYSQTDFVAFDEATGRPVVTQTYDGFDKLQLGQLQAMQSGMYRNTSIPASSEYSAMGQKALNERAVMTSTSTVKIEKVKISGTHYLKLSSPSNGAAVCSNVLPIAAGDLVLVQQGADKGIYHSGEADYNGIPLYPTTYYASGADNLNNPTVEILRSGKTNQLSTIAGEVVTYGQPQVPNLGNPDAAELAKRKQFATALTGKFETKGAQLLNVGSAYPFVKKPDHSPIPATTCIESMGPLPGTIQLKVKDTPSALDGCRIILPYDGPGKGAYFDVNDKGQLVYFRSNQICQPLLVQECIQLWPEFLGKPVNLGGVIAASATLYSDQWDFDGDLYGYPAPPKPDKYERGERGKWRPASSHRYQSELIPGSQGKSAARIYKDAGIFKEFQLFNFKDPAGNNPAKWLPQSRIAAYTPNGETQEEIDIAEKHSVAKFGYDHVLPTLLAHNASYGQVQFESFERLYAGKQLEDGLPLGNNQRTTTFAHSGKFALTLLNNQSLTLNPIIAAQEPSILKVWVKENKVLPDDITPGVEHPALKVTTGNATFDCRKVAQTGEWSLYEAEITAIGNFTPAILYKSGAGAAGVLIDDVRLQPRSSAMTTYVYDPSTLRLLASFDDQHFGLYYQYTPEGKLMRKFVETEKGKKTISETQYHVIPQNRN